MIGNLAGVLFDGIAYGSLLFIISIGLSVTMGLMNFVNLAHGAFAMLGGYVCVLLMTRAGVPFLATLPVAFVVVGGRRHRARAHALPAPVQGAAPRPGDVLDRPRVHGGRGDDVFLRAVAAAGAAARRTCAGRCACSGSTSAPTGCSSSPWSRC